MKYKRVFIQNSYVHLILVSYNREPIFIKNIEIIKNAIKNTHQNYTFEIKAICVLPDHIHLILFPEKIEEYPKIISSIKHYFSRNVKQVCQSDKLTNGYKNKREKGIFQRRYFEHTILSETDFKNQLDYIHYNPIKHNLVKKVINWEYSTFHKYLKDGIYSEDWGNNEDIENIKNINFE